MADALSVASLYRYPVKGLTPERLDAADLAAGAYFPGDRLFAIENGPSGFDAAAPRHQPKIKFLMLMRDEALAHLRTRFEDATETLVIREGEREAVRASLATEAGREALQAFFRDFLAGSLRGAPIVLRAPDRFRFTDAADGYVSLINRASVAAVEDFIGAPVDPLRFRGNLYLDGLAPFAEFDLIGRELVAPSGLRLRVRRRTQRCAATNVDPVTGRRDLDVPGALRRHLGHADLGVYAEVVTGGRLAVDETLALA